MKKNKKRRKSTSKVKGSKKVKAAGIDLTRVMLAPVSSLVHADWNYKTDGTPEQIEKLMKSIQRDKSAGVLAVREIKVKGKTKLEVIDGNHRLTAVKNLGWEKVHVENFGKISKAEAVTITRRRNHNWFEDDLLKLSNLFKDVVIPEFGIEELAEFMPDTEQDIQNLINLGEFDWETPETKVGKKDEEDTEEAEDGKEHMSKNKMHISIRVSNMLGRKMERRAKEEKFTNLEEFAVHCVSQYLKITEKVGKGKKTKKASDDV